MAFMTSRGFPFVGVIAAGPPRRPRPLFTLTRRSSARNGTTSRPIHEPFRRCGFPIERARKVHQVTFHPQRHRPGPADGTANAGTTGTGTRPGASS